MLTDPFGCSLRKWCNCGPLAFIILINGLGCTSAEGSAEAAGGADSKDAALNLKVASRRSLVIYLFL